MLQAILHNKFGKAISLGYFKAIEDTLTSSVIGLLQYLPDSVVWEILRGACGQSTVNLPVNIGAVLDYHFWERFDASGTKNSTAVEPDVWIETETFDIIIEAKRSDDSGDNSQYEVQWKNQIIALRNSYGGETPKPLIYIAIGGNDSLRDTLVSVDGKEYVIHTASWYNLLNVVLNLLRNYELDDKPAHTRRILQDIIQALQVHRFIKTTWLDSLPAIHLPDSSDAALFSLWDFDNSDIMAGIIPALITKEVDLQRIWTIAK